MISNAYAPRNIYEKVFVAVAKFVGIEVITCTLLADNSMLTTAQSTDCGTGHAYRR